METSILKKTILLLLVLTVAPVPVAWAQFGSNQGGQNTFFDQLVTPKAHGKPLTGTLDINAFANGQFVVYPSRCRNGTQAPNGVSLPLFTFTYNFRAVVDKTVMAFSHHDDTLCAEDLAEAALAFNAFVNTNVLPYFYPGTTSAVLKSYKMYVQPGAPAPGSTLPNCCDGREWIIVDLEFAVQ